MKSNEGYTHADLAAVSDNPEWTDDDFAEAKPCHEIFPDLAAALKDQSGIAAEGGVPRVPVGIDRELVESFRIRGPGWEMRLNDALRKVVEAAP